MPNSQQPIAADATKPQQHPSASGIQRGKDANGNSVYDNTGNLAGTVALANSGFGRDRSPASGGNVPSPVPAASTGGQPQVWSASHGSQAPGHYGPATQAPIRTATPATAGVGPMAQAVSPAAGQPATVAQSSMPASTAPVASAYGNGPRPPGGYPMPVQPEAVTAPQFQRVLPGAVPMMQVGGNRGASIQNPGDSTANKLQRALTSYSVKGSPSTRAAIAQAILGEAGARQGERMQALRTQDQAALNAQQANAAAAEGNANRRLAADKFNVESQDTREHRRQLVDLEKSKPFQIGTSNGNAVIARNDGTSTPITDASGAPVKFDTPNKGLSPDSVLKAWNDQANAINADEMRTPEQKQAALAELGSYQDFAARLSGGSEVNRVTTSGAPADGSIVESGGKKYVVRNGIPELMEKQ